MFDTDRTCVKLMVQKLRLKNASLNCLKKSIADNLLAKMSGDHKTLIKGSPSQYVKLNVGGTLFYTTIGTLTKSDNMLRTMFSGRMEVLTDAEGMFCETTDSIFMNL